MKDRRALLTAAPGFLQLQDQPPEVTLLRRWMDSWAGMGDVIAGLTRQGLDLELRKFQHGWRANLYPTGTAHSIVISSAWEPAPWRAVQQAAWKGAHAAEGSVSMWKLSAQRVEFWPTGICYRQGLTKATTMDQAVIDSNSVLRWPDTNAAAETNGEAVAVQIVPRDSGIAYLALLETHRAAWMARSRVIRRDPCDIRREPDGAASERTSRNQPEKQGADCRPADSAQRNAHGYTPSRFECIPNWSSNNPK